MPLRVVDVLFLEDKKSFRLIKKIPKSKVNYAKNVLRKIRHIRIRK